jgi:DMSO/TMAO reductase YedYZ molybdopterin-dependent catalytic subunit
MTSISRAFGRRRRDEVDPSRIPPGRCHERELQVLSAGPTPRTPVEEWMFSIHGAVDEARSWKWDEFTALPTEEVTVEIHCVTKWSKLDTRWKDVSVDTLFDGVDTEADWVTVTADGDHTTNLGLEDVTDGRRGSPTSTLVALTSPASETAPAWSRTITTNPTIRSTQTWLTRKQSSPAAASGACRI